MELDENGDVITYEEYFPYGGTSFIAGRNKKEIDLKEYRYSGKERDDLTGLYYYGYRYYAHWIGNWMSPDPAGPVDGLNLYQFVMNNPINTIDIDGLQSAEPENLPEYSGRIPFSEYGLLEYDFLMYSQNGERLYRKTEPLWDGEGPIDIRVVNGYLSEEMFFNLYGDELIALTDAIDRRTQEEPVEEEPEISSGSEVADIEETSVSGGGENEPKVLEDETVSGGEAVISQEPDWQTDNLADGQEKSVNEEQSSDLINKAEPSSVGEPGFAESLIPIWGSGRAAINHFQRGEYGWGAVHSALAITDVFLVKSIVTAGGKLIFKSTTQKQLLNSANSTGVRESAEVIQKKLGTIVTREGDQFAKSVNPDSNWLLRQYGAFSIEAQHQALGRLGNMAVNFELRGGALMTEGIEQLGKGGLRLLNRKSAEAWVKGSIRLGTPLNDIVPRNMSTTGLIFDPALDPLLRSMVQFGIPYLLPGVLIKDYQFKN